MIITYHGAGMVKLQAGETVAALNPIGRETGAKAPRFGADLALVSVADPAYNGVDNMSFGERSPFIIDGPGEYEVSGLFIQGIASSGPAGLINTIYTLSLDGLNVCHLGALTEPKLSEETVEAIGVVDVLFLPIGPERLGPTGGEQVSELLAPKLVIPVDWRHEAELKSFLQAAGESSPIRLPRLTIKRREVDGKEGEVVVIDPS